MIQGPGAGAPRRWARSLRLRLLLATLVAGALALLLAGGLLGRLFQAQVTAQFAQALTAQLDQVTAGLDIGADGRPRLDSARLVDPRWQRPLSGLYWQVDGPIVAGATALASAQVASEVATASALAAALPRGVLRSRSLWDATLDAPADALADGTVHVHPATGPDGARLLLVERTVRSAGAGGSAWRLLVAADLRDTEAAVTRFHRQLAVALALLGLLLAAAALAQVAVGLAPLRALQRSLAALRDGRCNRLAGAFPVEVQALIDDFNAVIDRNAEVVARARTQAGNLAHAIKTPLAALAQGAAAASGRPGAAAGACVAAAAADLPALVLEQVAMARRQVDWHLARARAAAAQGLPGAWVAVAPLAAGLLRVLARTHAERGLVMDSAAVAPEARFAGEAQDLQEMLGNLLDNACKWARQRVRVSAQAVVTAQGMRLQLVVEDDGPGIAAGRQAGVLGRGVRLDEQVPGSGLGLAIVHELVGLYQGTLVLADAPLGGLRVTLTLPGDQGGNASVRFTRTDPAVGG